MTSNILRHLPFCARGTGRRRRPLHHWGRRTAHSYSPAQQLRGLQSLSLGSAVSFPPLSTQPLAAAPPHPWDPHPFHLPHLSSPLPPLSHRLSCDGAQAQFVSKANN